LQQIDKRYRERFDMSMIENLEYIRDNGIHNFLKKQKTTYQCPECNGILCVHNGKCYSCERK
jgi:hypothetical protein